ncbi:MAG TPA: hypothetical protein VNM41_03035, partial [Solirubrobacterales bacterium]|nr:hypothetical protein [Solirubrobacterales bacterium]
MPAVGFPVFALKLPIGMPPLPVLGDLDPTFVLACLPPPGQKVPVPRAFLEAKLELGDPVPIVVDLSSPAGLVSVDAEVGKLSGDLLADLGKLVGIDDLGGFLPKTSNFDPSKVVELVDLGMTIAPEKPAVTSTRIELGSGLKWPLAKGIEIEGLRFQLVVPVDPPPETPPVFATAFGIVKLPGGELDISGAYGNKFQLAAGLGEGSHVKLSSLLDAFLPVELDADLYLDELEMIAATDGTWSLVVGLDGDWGFPLGNVEVALTKAWLELEHSGEETNGAIGATACLGSGKSALEFDGTWVLHEAFALKGSFPKVELKEVAALLAGHGPPAGLPEIALEKATASLLVGTGEEKTYDLALTAAASMAGQGLLGEAGFELRKDGAGFGFLLGILL